MPGLTLWFGEEDTGSREQRARIPTGLVQAVSPVLGLHPFAGSLSEETVRKEDGTLGAFGAGEVCQGCTALKRSAFCSTWILKIAQRAKERFLSPALYFHISSPSPTVALSVLRGKLAAAFSTLEEAVLQRSCMCRAGGGGRNTLAKMGGVRLLRNFS